MIKPDKALNDLPGGISEECRFNKIPLPADGIQFVGLPQALENIVFLVEKGGEIQNN